MNNSGSEVSGALASGSVDNVRWELSNPNTGSGTFNVLIRDKQSHKTVIRMKFC